ncbi:MAG TPA: DUF2029 domain-containing protein [Anaerolineae bacterium]|nr:DUF2029 domain-containing protein [Anaerolineae bacterium]
METGPHRSPPGLRVYWSPGLRPFCPHIFPCLFVLSFYGNPMKRSFDVLLLFILLLARLMLNKFAEASLFEHFQNVVRHPLVGGWLPPGAADAFGPWYGDPIFLLLAAVSLLTFILYIFVDLFQARWGLSATFRWKYGLLWVIILTLVILPTLKMALLRHDNLPHSYSHDGGVIQTEIAIDYFLSGKNPYIEDYRDTPMAEWGFPEFRTALDHYPYLPATFILSAPVRLISQGLIGWYDQRFTYLLLFTLILFLAYALTRGTPQAALGLTMVLGLNPIMGLDVIFGQNDVFILAWLVLSAWFLWRKQWVWGSVFFGIAAASKPTAWFLAPFFLLLLLDSPTLPLHAILNKETLVTLFRRALPAGGVFLAFTLPYFLWSPNDFIDDVWRWAAGTAETHYQIWGLGFANFVLATGSLADRFAYWPFWIPELLATVPTLLILLFHQLKQNTLANQFWHGAVLLLVFAYFSRFLNENYLGFLLALFALGYFLQRDITTA